MLQSVHADLRGCNHVTIPNFHVLVCSCSSFSCPCFPFSCSSCSCSPFSCSCLLLFHVFLLLFLISLFLLFLSFLFSFFFSCHSYFCFSCYFFMLFLFFFLFLFCSFLDKRAMMMMTIGSDWTAWAPVRFGVSQDSVLVCRSCASYTRPILLNSSPLWGRGSNSTLMTCNCTLHAIHLTQLLVCLLHRSR